jgi:hypothetical protein
VWATVVREGEMVTGRWAINGGMAHTAVAGPGPQAGPRDIKSIQIFFNQFL